ncbi:TPA: M42 family peptidase, partial [Enterococcus faecalis]|nr:M42 family peptidase [Enterococcus faecalis]HAP3308092.1 M42 family peptidase [Enterococcus faecalis]
HCYVDFQDYQAAKELVIQLIKNLDADKIQALVQPLSKECNK